MGNFHPLEIVGRGVLNVKKISSERVNPFRPEFTIVIFIHYKPRIAVAILDL